MDSARGSPCFGYLDLPTDNQVVCGALVVDGWLVDQTGT